MGSKIGKARELVIRNLYSDCRCVLNIIVITANGSANAGSGAGRAAAYIVYRYYSENGTLPFFKQINFFPFA